MANAETRFYSPQERSAYNAGFQQGQKEGLRKAGLMIQLMASDTYEFKESLIQNSKEAVQLRRLMTNE